MVGKYGTTAGLNSNVGTYAVEGSFVSPVGYRVNVQAGLVTVNPAPLTYTPSTAARAQGAPNILREVTFASSDVYGENFGTQGVCVGTGPLSLADSGSGGNDRLALEWTRVKTSPNLSNCIALAQRYSCDSF